MKIVSIGGGPAGLYFGILMKKAFPRAEITIYERNRADDTFGWGVVFSEETLGNIAEADPECYARIRERFAYWDDIETWYRGECIRSTGHGFCGLSRKRLLMILHDRCRELGVTLEFQREIRTVSEIPPADLVLAADGVNSMVRETYAASFRPKLDWRKCKFCWLGTTKPLGAFTFIFKETEHGLFQVHAYPFEKDASTFIVECREETWKRAGLDRASEEETVAFCEALFAEHLDGHEILTNRSLWRTFPTVTNERWRHENLVLVGDAAHTAHFSIGSGTKLAMEDAMALVEAFQQMGTEDVPAALAAYEESRRVEVIKTQKAAQSSLEWFENSSRYMGQDAIPLTFNLMTRSKRLTYDNLRLRDPALVARTNEWFRAASGSPVPSSTPAGSCRTQVVGSSGAADQPSRSSVAPSPAPDQTIGETPPPIFTPFHLRGLALENRIVVSPMCQYSAVDGTPNDWHLVHLGSRAVGGAGLVMTEMTDVMAEGRITLGCAGMYEDAHSRAWKRIVEFVHGHSNARIGIQLAHAGRKGSCVHPWEGEDRPLSPGEGAWETIGPSPGPFHSDWPAPRRMDRSDMDRVRDAFVRAARLAERAGFDLIELHMAHGYLLSSFISPLSNRRDDEYGGSLENRMRYPLEVFDAVRAVWPEEKPISVRISASDWLDDEGGLTPADSVLVAKMLKAHACDIVDVSSAGNVPESEPVYGRMYQVPFAEKIRYGAEIPVMAVGAILDWDHANTVLAAGRADLCALARPHLKDPYLTLHAAAAYGYDDQDWPGQYLLGKPRSKRPV